MALPQSMVFASCVAYLMLVLQLSAAPLETTLTLLVTPSPEPRPNNNNKNNNNVTTTKQPTTVTPMTTTTITSPRLSSTLLPPSSSPVTSFSSSTTASPALERTPSSPTSTEELVEHFDTTQAITETSQIITTEDPFSSDEAIRHLPGYWIKRPLVSAAGGGIHLISEDEEEEDSGEAQESFIDYRTERYQIADLFPATSPLPLERLAEENTAPVIQNENLQHSAAQSQSQEGLPV